MQRKILIVDDLQMFIEIEKEYFKDTRADILTAKDGIEALNVVKTMRPDIVFMDLEMPRMDGATCCKAIKADPAVTRVPVVMVTSKGNEERCNLAGCDHFLTKPLDRDIFLESARLFIPDIDRRERRLTVNIDCIVHLDEQSMPCRLSDVSMGGAFIVTDYRAVPGTVVKIAFVLPDGTPVVCSGRISWVNKVNLHQCKGFGVKFSLMPKEAKTALSNFLETVV